MKIYEGRGVLFQILFGEALGVSTVAWGPSEDTAIFTNTVGGPFPSEMIFFLEKICYRNGPVEKQ